MQIWLCLHVSGRMRMSTVCRGWCARVPATLARIHPTSVSLAPELLSTRHNSCSNTGRTDMVDGFAHSVLLSVVPVILVEQAPSELLCLHED